MKKISLGFLKMERNNADHIVSVLQPFVSAHKQSLIEEVLQHRTRHIALVFEDIDKPHNISAVVRTAECLGIQDIHFIKNKNDYSVNPTITQGAAKWLTFYHHNSNKNNIDACYDHLRSNGYSIYATSLRKTSVSIEELDTSNKMAIVFGTEADGISQEAAEKADGLIHIPMVGFTESFNLSVSAALILNTLSNTSNFPTISTQEQQELRAEWYRKVVREADLIIKNHKVKT